MGRVGGAIVEFGGAMILPASVISQLSRGKNQAVPLAPSPKGAMTGDATVVSPLRFPEATADQRRLPRP